MMTIEEANSIINDFGKSMALVNATDVSWFFPTRLFPQSLLPYPKDQIYKAFAVAKLLPSDDEDLALLDIGEQELSRFINDWESFLGNIELLKSDKYVDEIEKYKSEQ